MKRKHNDASSQTESTAFNAPFSALNHPAFEKLPVALWLEMQQHWMATLWEWSLWYHKTMTANMMESAKWMMHGLELMNHPTAYYRYLRANWQKPLMGASAQALTATRLMTHMMVENGVWLNKNIKYH